MEHVCVSVCMTASHPRNFQLNAVSGNFSGVGVKSVVLLVFFILKQIFVCSYILSIINVHVI